jgi:hypothetical protein
MRRGPDGDLRCRAGGATHQTAGSFPGIPILAAKITVPGVPDWAVPRPRITKLIAEGHAAMSR